MRLNILDGVARLAGVLLIMVALRVMEETGSTSALLLLSAGALLLGFYSKEIEG